MRWILSGLCLGALLLSAPAEAFTYDVVSLGATWTAPDGTTQPQAICANKIVWDGASTLQPPAGFRFVRDDTGSSICWQAAPVAPTLDPLVQSAISSAMSTVQAQIPVPLGTVPIGGTLGGTVGTAGTYIPGNAAPAIQVQRANTTLGTNCAWSVTFAQAFGTSTPSVNVVPFLASGMPTTCWVSARSATAVSGACAQAQTVTLNLSIVTAGLTLNPFASTCPAIPLMVVAGAPTQ